MATIWEDDFESGNALAVSYGIVSNAETNATCGQDGGWGCRTIGTDNQKYFGYFRYTPASAVESEYLKVKIDLDHAYANYDDVPAWLFSLANYIDGWGVLTYLSLYHGADTGDDKTVLWLESAFEAGWGPYSATGAITLGSWQTIQMEVWFSTYLAGSPWTPNADGRVKVSVDGVAVIDSATLKIQSWHTSVDGTPNVTDYVYFGPMGNGDSLGLYTAGVWLDIANFNEVLLDSALFNGRIPSVQMEIWTGDHAATIQARLYDGDAGASVGESIVVTGTTPTKVEFDVDLNTGQHPYRLQVTSEASGVALFCAGPGLLERPGGEYEEPPVEPDPPPVSDRPAWWKDYDGTIPMPRTSGTFHLEGAGSFTQYRWTGVSAIIDNREGPMAFAGDLHGDVDVNTAARIEFVEVAGATAYRIYVFNCTSGGELFDAHLHNTNLVVATGTGPVLVQFKDVTPPPNWGGWPPESGFEPEDIPNYECDFLGDSDGTTWVMWP